MKLHKILLIKAEFSTDHSKIKTACKKHKVPYTKYYNNRNIYCIDLCTVKSIDIQKVMLDLKEITPINLKMLKEGFEYKPKVFLD